ncbi:hypothetical protein Tcan_00810, partial [Toxocara canis]
DSLVGSAADSYALKIVCNLVEPSTTSDLVRSMMSEKTLCIGCRRPMKHSFCLSKSTDGANFRRKLAPSWLTGMQSEKSLGPSTNLCQLSNLKLSLILSVNSFCVNSDKHL